MDDVSEVEFRRALEAAQGACLELPNAVEEYPFGEETAVFKVSGKMFAMIGMTELPTTITLKVMPDHGEALVRDHPAVRPGYHMNKRHWVTVDLAGEADSTFVEDLVGNSYDLVVAKLPRHARPAVERSASLPKNARR